ncbi:hypothetical protein EB118_00815 [bacterium]|nr:hypothetical protein [bacterium]NDD82837.1 hypothetical protein [bacterium]NDG28632.1 hypothetical protein [bacterium]
MKTNETYTLLEEKMKTYSELAAVDVVPNNEPLVSIGNSEILRARPIDNNMEAYTANAIFVRSSVQKMLGIAAIMASDYSPDLQLEVVYGYRPLTIQKDLFEYYRNKLTDKYSGNELLEAVHRLIAVPEVSGHPTGGAVDVQLCKNGVPIEFGTNIWEFTPDSYTFSPFINRTSWSNRQLLRRIMLNVGFAPFDGEWWHFSYGDKEWASYYNKQYAMYQQTEFTNL